uniref:Uncharacterized protein n=1 Tax=Sphaerodactylus townsendi TaxID=933632 RepID=A0ACB8FMH3_9SAUR
MLESAVLGERAGDKVTGEVSASRVLAERNRAASKAPKLGKMAAERRKSVKTLRMKEPAHQPNEQRQSAAAARGDSVSS